MKLIGSFASPFARKVRIFLLEKNFEYEFINDDIWSDDSQVHLINPLGKVPCLIFETDSVMFDSRTIVDYLDDLSTELKLIPRKIRDRAIVKSWEALSDGVVDAAALIRLENIKRPENKRSDFWINRQEGKLLRGLESLSRALGKSRYCYKDRYSLADISLCCALGWIDFRFPEINWKTKHPNLENLFNKVSKRESFKLTQPR